MPYFVAGSSKMIEVDLRHVSASYDKFTAVDNVSLEIRRSEFFSLLGPSGCGKSTTLRMVAGFVAPSSGQILIKGQNVTALPPEARNIGIVFQNYAIFPHLTVFENIAFGLRMRKFGQAAINKAVGEALDQVGLHGFDLRYQRELSGGEQQRVALARVLVTKPSILLLDEPLSALDKQMRDEMKFWIKDLQHQLGITTIYVTHDQGEALTMSDRIAVMRNGRIEQIGTPREIYEAPENMFVTKFVGESNIFQAKVHAIAQGRTQLGLLGQRAFSPVRDGVVPGQEVNLIVRPEHVLLGDETARIDVNRFKMRVIKQNYQGSLVRYHLECLGCTIVAESSNTRESEVLSIGQDVEAGWFAENSSLIPINGV